MSNVTKMSLHRVLAEIKNTEQKLKEIANNPFVYTTIASEPAENITNAKLASQSSWDKTTASIHNLAVLKAARNKANAEVQVTVGSKAMTIDEALSLKAAQIHKSNLISTIQAQFNNATNSVTKAQADLEKRYEAQVATMFSGTKKASETEMKAIRDMLEASLKPSIIFVDGLKENLQTLKDEVESFKTEVDYVLSEANATNTVEVVLM